MTRINTACNTVPKPDSVLFGELAIAAGLAGQPVAVCFLESTATIDCELWNYFSEFALAHMCSTSTARRTSLH